MKNAAITRWARHTEGFEQRLAHSVQVLSDAAAAHAGAIVQATSLGAEDMVITALVHQHALGIALATLDTGQLHTQTLALLPRIAERYGLHVQRYAPAAEHTVQFVQRHGERAMYDSVHLRKACCALRKLEPLGRLLAGHSAWVTGLRRAQSADRSVVEFVETDRSDPAVTRQKINPLAAWSQDDVWHFIDRFEVPYNALHDDFFTSIGCAPCTRAVALGEDPRAGRWWWEQDNAKECGLHGQAAALLSAMPTLSQQDHRA
jgi:phosphoadenosine phosphosulfate reductase